MCTLNLGALELDHEATAGFDQLVWLDAEHVMPCAGRRPHLGVLQQVGIDEHAQLSGMAERRHATDCLLTLIHRPVLPLAFETLDLVPFALAPTGDLSAGSERRCTTVVP